MFGIWVISGQLVAVLGTTETPHIDHGVGHQLHPVVPMLEVLKTEQQPLEFVLPRKRPFYPIPQCMDCLTGGCEF